MTMTGAQALIKGLEEAGVEIVFGYPGGAILPVYDALKESKIIKHVLVRQEQGGAHAASGYARVSGKTGVCMATSGPGATNLVTGIATAYMDSVAMVIITGQVATKMVGTDAFQEVDITGITHPITKHNYLVQQANDIPRIVQEAFHIASTGRPGPVLIDIPKDVAEDLCYKTIPQEVNLPGYKPTIKGHVTQIKNACKLMAEAKKPLILGGGGVNTTNSGEELLRLSEILKAPVISTLMGLGAIPADHQMNLGMLGMHGHPGANKAVTECDLLISVGVRFGDRMTGLVNKFAPQAKIIHIDIDPAEIGKNLPVDVPIVGHVKMVLKAIHEYLPFRNISEHPTWLEQVKKWQKENYVVYLPREEELTTHFVLDKLNQLAPKDLIVTADVGQHQMFAAQLLNHQGPHSFISSGGLGTMGYGFPAAVGAQMAKPQALVVSIVGDGGFQMSMHELATAKEQGLPIKIFIFNNNCLALVRQLQHFYCDQRQMAVAMPGNPDFVKLAAAYDIPGYRICCPGDVENIVEEVFHNGKLTIVDCLIECEEFVYPTVLTGKGLDEMVIGKGENHE